MPRLTRKGQVTIPQQIRSFLGAKAGDEIIFEDEALKVEFELRLYFSFIWGIFTGRSNQTD